MDAAPEVDDATGAAPGDVVAGKTYWGVRSGSWGPRVGTWAPAPVGETGQVTSYATGDDGDLKPGVAWPNPRFTDNGNGTVTDNLTGLIWLKNANCFGTRFWSTALNDANTLAAPACGLSDGTTAGMWRLPSVNELQSLLDYEFYNPALSDAAGTTKWGVVPANDAFSGVQSYSYWSSSSVAGGPSRAWSVGLYYGDVSAYNKPSVGYVWPVRGGQ